MKVTSVAVIAYACQPGRGSEPGAGLAAVSAWCRLAKTVHVLVQREDVSTLTSSGSTNLGGKVILHPVGSQRLKRTLQRLFGSRLGTVLNYYFWIDRINQRLPRLVSEEKIEVVVHATFTSIFLPPVRSRMGIPVLWGPLGGGATHPSPLIKNFRRRDRVFLRSRRRLFRFATKLNLLRLEQDTYPLYQNMETQIWATELGRHIQQVNCKFSGVAFDETTLRELATVRQARTQAHSLAMPKGSGEPFVLLTAARLVPFKAIPILIEALRNQPNFVLRIAGSGGQLKSLRRLARLLSVEDRIFFLGRLSRSEVYKELEFADAFTFASLHDGSAWSVAEAYESGVPIIILDTAGADCLGGREVGVLKVGADERVIEGFEEAFSEFKTSKDALWSSASLRKQYFTIERLAYDYGSALDVANENIRLDARANSRFR